METMGLPNLVHAVSIEWNVFIYESNRSVRSCKAAAGATMVTPVHHLGPVDQSPNPPHSNPWVRLCPHRVHPPKTTSTVHTPTEGLALGLATRYFWLVQRYLNPTPLVSAGNQILHHITYLSHRCHRDTSPFQLDLRAIPDPAFFAHQDCRSGTDLRLWCYILGWIMR